MVAGLLKGVPSREVDFSAGCRGVLDWGRVGKAAPACKWAGAAAALFKRRWRRQAYSLLRPSPDLTCSAGGRASRWRHGGGRSQLLGVSSCGVAHSVLPQGASARRPADQQQGGREGQGHGLAAVHGWEKACVRTERGQWEGQGGP